MSKYILAFTLLALLVLVVACGSKKSTIDAGKVIKSAQSEI